MKSLLSLLSNWTAGLVFVLVVSLSFAINVLALIGAVYLATR